MNNLSPDTIEYIKDMFSFYNISVRSAIYEYEKYYHIDYIDNYYDYKDDEYWQADNYPDIAKVASFVFGISEQDIISCDENTFEKVLSIYNRNNYSDFFDAPSVISERIRGGFFPGNLGNLLGILTKGLSLNKAFEYAPISRYDYGSIPKRLIDELKKDSEYNPSLFHNGQKITKLTVTTEHFVSYPFVEKYINAFACIVERIGVLFNKIITHEITESEIIEYNILALSLDARLVFFHAERALYWNVLRFKGYIREHQYKTITSYLTFDFWKINEFQPWRCQEFTEKIETAQCFFDYVPEAKSEMRNFAMRVKYFECNYTWADSPRIVFSEEEEWELREDCEAMEEEYIEPADRPQITHTYYLKKTKQELGKDALFAKRLLSYAASSKLGGIKAVIPEGRVYVNKSPNAFFDAIQRSFLGE